jgi:hypothetical protein
MKSLSLSGSASGSAGSDHFLEAALEHLAAGSRPPVGKLTFELVERMLFLSHSVLQTVDVSRFRLVCQARADTLQKVGFVVDIA